MCVKRVCVCVSVRSMQVFEHAIVSENVYVLRVCVRCVCVCVCMCKERVCVCVRSMSECVRSECVCMCIRSVCVCTC